ncbi:MAG: hypothetical protein AAB676_19930, partial [Verrucomicrobiota bacterium]
KISREITEKLPTSRECAPATPLAPALTALLALADRSHPVAVQQTARGIQVVLRHNFFNSPTHRHGMVARALTMIAERPVGSQPDHVIQFAASATSEQASALAIEPAPGAPAPGLFPSYDFLTCPARPTAVPAAHPRPPPGTSGLLLSLRSTVLVI